MRLFRGSGISGLACMKQIQTMDDGTRRIRPLLYQSKASLEATCKERDVPFVLDPSNFDLTYDRNRIRSGVQQLRSSGLLQGPMLLETIAYFQSVHFNSSVVTQSDSGRDGIGDKAILPRLLSVQRRLRDLPIQCHQTRRSSASLHHFRFLVCVFHLLQCCGGFALESAARRRLRSERFAASQRRWCEIRR